MPVLKKVANIREVIMNKSDMLSNPHFVEALEIADQIEEIKTRSGNNVYGSNEPSVSRKEIEELAARARKCVRELGGSRSGK